MLEHVLAIAIVLSIFAVYGLLLFGYELLFWLGGNRRP